MEHFLLNSSVCLFVFWLFYKLVLENTSWHHFKRFYLLASIGISLIIPFIVVKTVIVSLDNNAVVDLVNLNTSEAVLEESGFEFQWYYILLLIYFTGVIIMLWRFITNLRTFTIRAEDEVISYNSYQLILRNGITVPHSFLNRIFVSKTDHDQNLIPNAVLNHEKAHLDQKHSFDILLIEALIALFWFNPLFYMYRSSMKLNHEFLADRCVIQQGVNTPKYQELILRHATTNYQQSIANTFHFPIIKKRFKIMKTQTSTISGLLRSLAIIPIITILVLSCGEDEIKFEAENENTVIEEQVMTPEEAFGENTIMIINNQPKGKTTIDNKEYTFIKEADKYKFYTLEGDLFDYESKGYEVIEIIEVLEEVTAKDIEEYNRLAKKHKTYMEEHENLIVWNDETSLMQTIYNSMSNEQRAANEPWPYIGNYYGMDYEGGQIPPPPPPVSESEVQEIDEVVETLSAINQKMTSISIFISDKGNYFVNDKKVTEKDLISLINNLSQNDYSNIYVFMFESDYKKFAMKRKPEDVYIYVKAKNYKYDKNDVLSKFQATTGLKPLKLASEHEPTKGYALELAKAISKIGVQNISI